MDSFVTADATVTPLGDNATNSNSGSAIYDAPPQTTSSGNYEDMSSFRVPNSADESHYVDVDDPSIRNSQYGGISNLNSGDDQNHYIGIDGL